MWLIVVDELGNEELSVKYPIPRNGRAWHFFVDLNHDEQMEILGFENHSTLYYPGTSQIHIFDQNGNVTHSFDGASDDIWEHWEHAVSDINSDGIDEIIASNCGDNKVYILNHNLSVLESAPLDGNVQLVCDINGDSSNEIVLLDDRGNLKVFPNF